MSIVIIILQLMNLVNMHACATYIYFTESRAHCRPKILSSNVAIVNQNYEHNELKSAAQANERYCQLLRDGPARYIRAFMAGLEQKTMHSMTLTYIHSESISTGPGQ